MSAKKEKKMVFLDTSVLITWAQDTRPNHQNLIKHLEYLLETYQVSFCTSSIVLAEYLVKGTTEELKTHHIDILSFGEAEAVIAADVWIKTFERPDSGKTARTQFKADVKILAHAISLQVDYILTEDEGFYKTAQSYRSIKGLKTEVLDCKETFQLYNPELPFD